jgi:alpha-L-fucosidase
MCSLGLAGILTKEQKGKLTMNTYKRIIGRRVKLEVILVALICMTQVHSGSAQENRMASEWERMHRSKEQAFREFNDAKFGMMVHWGLYSVLAGTWKEEEFPGIGCKEMQWGQIPRNEYRAIAPRFHPGRFNAEQWVKAAKMAGMRYMVITAKHHDGFSMYDSDVTDFDIIDATPFGRDPMVELYEACKKHGIRFSLYYSHATDWMDGGDAGAADYLKLHPEQKKVNAEFQKAHPGHQGLMWYANTWDPAPVSFDEYLDGKAEPQMRELLERFPGMQEVWYDVPGKMTAEQSYRFYKLAFQIQPSCLINSRVGNGFGDFLIPGDNVIPGKDLGARYWETVGTLNDTWGYKTHDTAWKSTEELLFWITEITSKGGNYLLNVGPTAEGLFPEESLEQLRSIGDWMSMNGEAVYGTKRWLVSHEGPTKVSMKGTIFRKEHGFHARFTPEDFWFSAKDHSIYVTSLIWPDNDRVLIRSFAQLPEHDVGSIISVQMLGLDRELQWEMLENGLRVLLPAERPSPLGYVLKINVKKLK